MPEKSWFFAIKDDDLKESSMGFARVKGTPVLLIRKNGTVYSLFGKCKHMGCRLSKGTFSDEYVLKCPCHGWEYDIRSGEYLGDKDEALSVFENKVEDGEILVLL
ncbi:Rieske (2Fe-2S) protein [Methanolobus bombayensis]|uniref:Rieske (2Fe-2S) protein n=1 Tax=Methanolobus bombayensis TaxID=38023 RepID=UPI001AE863E2|nr:Rieske (2Fe-2S) protein [Methanolobus bombayensis]MBP1909743.1 nitrite reductase/ring-hydroxylating ferredoxin subunit [Methanolobus bombayensis]